HALSPKCVQVIGWLRAPGRWIPVEGIEHRKPSLLSIVELRSSVLHALAGCHCRQGRIDRRFINGIDPDRQRSVPETVSQGENVRKSDGEVRGPLFRRNGPGMCGTELKGKPGGRWRFERPLQINEQKRLPLRWRHGIPVPQELRWAHLNPVEIP